MKKLMLLMIVLIMFSCKKEVVKIKSMNSERNTINTVADSTPRMYYPKWKR